MPLIDKLTACSNFPSVRPGEDIDLTSTRSNELPASRSRRLNAIGYNSCFSLGSRAERSRRAYRRHQGIICGQIGGLCTATTYYKSASFAQPRNDKTHHKLAIHGV
jgi:hypothetical protein